MGEEEHVVPTRHSCNDAKNTADNPEHERSSVNLRKHQTIRNVQGMTAGKLKKSQPEWMNNTFGVLGISETWWLKQGHFTTDDGCTVIYSGKDSGKREHGVGFILNRNTARSVLGFNPINN